VLDPDVAAKFKTSRAVNDVLRQHLVKPRRGTLRRRPTRALKLTKTSLTLGHCDRGGNLVGQ
jgi:hypothetical protein